MRLGIFRLRTVPGANVAGFILGTAMFAMFLMLTLYMQQVLGYSPMKTGVAYLAVAGTSIIWSAVAAAARRRGRRQAGARHRDGAADGRPARYFTQVSVGGSYLGDLLPGLPRDRVGMAFCVRADLDRGARRRRSDSEAGLASGLINTSQQIGGALGIAVLSTIATTRRRTPSPAAPPFRTRSWTGSRSRSSSAPRSRRSACSSGSSGGLDPCATSRRSRQRAGAGAGRRSRPAQAVLRAGAAAAQLLRAGDDDVGGPAELRGPFGRGDGDAHAVFEAVQRAEGVQVGRVVAREQRAAQARAPRAGARRRCPCRRRSAAAARAPSVPSAATSPRARRRSATRSQHAHRRRLVARRCGSGTRRSARFALGAASRPSVGEAPRAARATAPPPARARGRARRCTRARPSPTIRARVLAAAAR